MEEEHIVEDGEIIKDEDLMSDSQFSGNDTNDSTSRADKQYSVTRQKRQNLSSIDELTDSMKDADAVAYIETSEVDPDDPLNLEQICVPVDGDNVSWIGLSS